MDMMTFLRYVLMIIETVSLIAALVYATKSIKEKNESSSKTVRKAYIVKSVIFIGVYFGLHILRNSVL